MSDDVTVTVQHVYSVPAWNGVIGYCGRGARVWFARHGLDWGDFVRDGLPASVLEATGDALAQRVVDHARALAEPPAQDGEEVSGTGTGSEETSSEETSHGQ